MDRRMTRSVASLIVFLVIGLMSWPGAARAQSCAKQGAFGAVQVGPLCVDVYEASVWSKPDGGGTQYGISSADYPCNATGNDCTGTKAIFARSVAGVTPSAFITWFQAQQACANAGKRLLTNAEWQMAAAGTPDGSTTSCNTHSGAVATTGSFTACVSNYGVKDIVGNLAEWVADWVPRSTACGSSEPVNESETVGFQSLMQNPPC